MTLFRDMIKGLTSPKTTKQMKLYVLLSNGSRFNVSQNFNTVFTSDSQTYMGRTVYVQIFGNIDEVLIQEKNVVALAEIDLLNYAFMEKTITGSISQAKCISLGNTLNWELILWFPAQQPEIKPAK